MTVQELIERLHEYSAPELGDMDVKILGTPGMGGDVVWVSVALGLDGPYVQIQGE